MPKLKTKSSVKKRFRITASGKIRHNVANKRHLLTAKSTKMKRQHRGTDIVCDADRQIIKKFMPYGKF